MENIIQFDRVSKRYEGEKSASVRGVTCAVSEGEFLCLIGPSGCGKTSLLKLIAGIEKPTSGTLKVPKKIAMSFQSGALFPWLTVFENAAFGLRIAEMPEAELSRTVDTQLEMLGMIQFRDKYPSDLSGGQRQRVGIARALAVDPVVLLLDEPFSALDPKTTAELHDDLIKIWLETKKTIVMVSHLIEEAVSLAGKVILMHEGSIDEEFKIELPYPRRENEGFHREVMKIRREFFKR